MHEGDRLSSDLREKKTTENDARTAKSMREHSMFLAWECPKRLKFMCHQIGRRSTAPRVNNRVSCVTYDAIDGMKNKVVDDAICVTFIRSNETKLTYVF